MDAKACSIRNYCKKSLIKIEYHLNIQFYIINDISLLIMSYELTLSFLTYKGLHLNCLPKW
jgi:hypothetical protein